MDKAFAPHLIEKYERELYNAGLDIDTIRQLKNQGWNQSEIAEFYGVTRQAVSYIWRKYGGELSLRQRVIQAMPYEPGSTGPFSKAAPMSSLRDHAEFMMTGTTDRWAVKRINRLRGFYNKLRSNNWVVEYDPNIPSEPGVSKPGGFAYRPREPRDGNLLIRVNKYTNPTEYEGKNIWQFPPQDP